MNQDTTSWTKNKGGQSLAEYLKFVRMHYGNIVTIVPMAYKVEGGLDFMSKESELTEALIVYEKKA